MYEPKYPDITVRLIGKKGNAFHILGKCLAANETGKHSQRRARRVLPSSHRQRLQPLTHHLHGVV